jgi:hypothetical protein
MRHARERQLVHVIHVARGQRNGRRVQPHVEVAVALHQRARIAGVALEMQDAIGVRVQHRIGRHRLERRHADHAAFAVFGLHAPRELHDDFARRRGLAGFHRRGLLVGLADLGLHRIRIDGRIQRPRRIDVRGIDLDEVVRLAHERSAAQVDDVGNLRAARQAMRDLDDLPFGIAEHQQVGLGIQQH